MTITCFCCGVRGSKSKLFASGISQPQAGFGQVTVRAAASYVQEGGADTNVVPGGTAIVTDGARALLLAERRDSFAAAYVDPLLTEAARLGLTPEDLISTIRDRARRSEPTTTGGTKNDRSH